MRLYVGNISFETTDEELRSLFSAFGEVKDVANIVDRQTDRPRGFAFVTMANGQDADSAIKALHQTVFGGRTIVVSVARERDGKRNAPRAERAYAWD